MTSVAGSRERHDRVGGVDVRRRNHVVVTGRKDGRPMVFAHGFGCDQTMWRFVAPRFADTHRVVTFDFVGFGGSDLAAHDPVRYGSLGGYALDVLEVLDALGLRDVIFVGSSVAAMIGVVAAIREPDRIGAPVLVGPSPRDIDDDGYVGGFTVAEIEGCCGRSRATTSGGRARWLP